MDSCFFDNNSIDSKSLLESTTALVFNNIKGNVSINNSSFSNIKSNTIWSGSLILIAESI